MANNNDDGFYGVFQIIYPYGVWRILLPKEKAVIY